MRNNIWLNPLQWTGVGMREPPPMNGGWYAGTPSNERGLVCGNPSNERGLVLCSRVWNWESDPEVVKCPVNEFEFEHLNVEFGTINGDDDVSTIMNNTGKRECKICRLECGMWNRGWLCPSAESDWNDERWSKHLVPFEVGPGDIWTAPKQRQHRAIPADLAPHDGAIGEHRLIRLSVRVCVCFGFCSAPSHANISSAAWSVAVEIDWIKFPTLIFSLNLCCVRYKWWRSCGHTLVKQMDVRVRPLGMTAVKRGAIELVLDRSLYGDNWPGHAGRDGAPRLEVIKGPNLWGLCGRARMRHCYTSVINVIGLVDYEPTPSGILQFYI